MATVDIKNLRKSFGAVEVLKGIDVHIADGEFLAILGESGCGKSTLLRILAGLEDATSGVIAIDDVDVTHQSPRQRDIAMVFQSYALYPHMSVRENIEFPLETTQLTKADRAERVNTTAAMLNLTDYLDRKPRDLSGGQRQRVAMGRAIVREPKVFLFDEPLSNLDAKLRVQMRSEIRTLQQRLAITAVYVTHDQVEALTMADRVILMNAGQIEQIGAPLDLYDRPASVFVASFVGAPPMNLFAADSITVDGQPGLRMLGTELAMGFAGAAGRPITAGFRPEHARIGEAGALSFSGVVVSQENTGDRIIAVVRVGDHEVNLALTERHDLKAGMPLTFSVAPGNIHIFDADSGARSDG